MTDPTHRHGYDPDDLMAWRRATADDIDAYANPVLDDLDDIQRHLAHEGGPQFDDLLSAVEWYCLAWAGEVGEVLNEVKKIRRDAGSDVHARRERVVAELIDAHVYEQIIWHLLYLPASVMPALVTKAHQAFLARPETRP